MGAECRDFTVVSAGIRTVQMIVVVTIDILMLLPLSGQQLECCCLGCCVHCLDLRDLVACWNIVVVITIVAVVTPDAAGIFLQGNDDVASNLVVDNTLVEILDQFIVALKFWSMNVPNFDYIRCIYYFKNL